MDKAQDLFFAVVGAGDFAVEKVNKGARKLTDRKVTQKYYKDFIKRGKSLSTKVRSTGPAKKAATKSTRTQTTPAPVTQTQVS